MTRSASPLLALLAHILNALGRVPEAFLLLLGRIAVGAVFFKSGLTKVDTETFTIAPSTFELFREEYRVPILPPELAAYLGTFNELTMPLLLILGLAGRLSAAALLGMTFVIQVFVYPTNWAEHLTWAVPLLFVLTRGPGVFSIDHLVASRLFERRPRYAM